MEDPMLKQAKEALDKLSADPKARIRAEMREMAELSHELGLTRAHSQGQVKLLSHQLTLKFGDLPAAVVTRLANATEPQLLRWSERVLSADSLDAVFER